MSTARISRTSSTATTTDNDLAIAQALANEEQELADQDYAMRMQMGHHGNCDAGAGRPPRPTVVVRGRDVAGTSPANDNRYGGSNSRGRNNSNSRGRGIVNGTSAPSRASPYAQQPLPPQAVPPSPFASLFAPAASGYSNNGENGKYMEPPSAPVPSHMCQVPVILGENICVEMMVDTGAQSSVITLPLVKRLGLESRLDNREQGIANGVGQARIIGKLRNIVVELGHVEFYMDFIVLDTEDSILLLGLDQMRKYKCIVDLENETILFGGNGGVEVKMLPPTQQQMPRQYSPYGNCPIS